MTNLVACLSAEKKTLNHLMRVIEGMEWDNIFLITDETSKNEFQSKKKVEMIVLNLNKTISEISADIKKALERKIIDLEVALNIVCGDGRIHMAIISALLQLGLGMRLIALTKDGVKEI